MGPFCRVGSPDTYARKGEIVNTMDIKQPYILHLLEQYHTNCIGNYRTLGLASLEGGKNLRHHRKDHLFG